MHIVLGASGHVGSALVDTLLARREPVTLVVRDRSKARAFEIRGARVEVADIHDVDALRHVYRLGNRLFMLNPPAAPTTDTQTEERQTVTNMLQALEDSALEKVVALSTFGARPGELTGDLNVLYEMEQGLDRSGVPHSVIRAAYYMSNWDTAMETARTEGVMRTFFPVDLKIPMVAAKDVGDVAAQLMTAPIEHTARVQVEGPARYSSADVAAAFANALHREVKAEVIPERNWIDAFKTFGFSDQAATSYANMTRTVCEDEFPPTEETLHGKISLDDYIKNLVNRTADPQ
jgi:uncharacterized protein YbjT (DUF2867 family)